MHTLPAGAMGTLILSMMPRVSIGNTGRQITSPLITISMLMTTLAVVKRVLGAWLLPESGIKIILISVFFWCSAYGLFLISFLLMLVAVRPDGKEG